MQRTTADALDSGYTGDFALIDTDGDYVVLEANEWDAKVSGYQSVTLYLHPE